MKKLSILAFAMGLIAFTACSEKKAPAPAPAQAEQTVVTDSAFQAAAAGVSRLGNEVVSLEAA